MITRIGNSIKQHYEIKVGDTFRLLYVLKIQKGHYIFHLVHTSKNGQVIYRSEQVSGTLRHCFASIRERIDGIAASQELAAHDQWIMP